MSRGSPLDRRNKVKDSKVHQAVSSRPCSPDMAFRTISRAIFSHPRVHMDSNNNSMDKGIINSPVKATQTNTAMLILITSNTTSSNHTDLPNTFNKIFNHRRSSINLSHPPFPTPLLLKNHLAKVHQLQPRLV